MDQGDGVVVPKTLNYSQGLGTTAVFYFLNESPHTYVFKIRTNQKKALSLHSSHGFLRPHSQLDIPVKIIEKPSPAIPLKLEVNYALATQQEIEGNNSKRAITAKVELTKRVILLKEGQENDMRSTKIVEVSEKVVQNHANEDDSALDSIIKKDLSQNGVDSSQHHPKLLLPTIRTPSKTQGVDSVDQQMGTLFRHTYSIDKPLEVEQIPLQSDQQVKTDVFATVKQQTSPLSSSRDEQFNPFSMLLQSVKTESGITIRNKQKENDEKEEKVTPQTAKQEKASDPFAILFQSLRKQETSPAKQQQNLTEKSQSVIDIKKVQEEREESLALESELHELNIRIQCHESFIKELKSMPQIVPVKKYPRVLFITLSLLFFFLGGIAKHFVL